MSVCVRACVCVCLQSKFSSKEWDPAQNKLKAETLKKLAEFEADHPNSADKDLVRCYCCEIIYTTNH